VGSDSERLSVQGLRNGLLHDRNVQSEVLQLLLEDLDELLLQEVLVALAHGTHHKDLPLGLLRIQEVQDFTLGGDGGVDVGLQLLKFLL